MNQRLSLSRPTADGAISSEMPQPYLVLKDTMCSCEAHGMRPKHEEKKMEEMHRPPPHLPTPTGPAHNG